VESRFQKKGRHEGRPFGMMKKTKRGGRRARGGKMEVSRIKVHYIYENVIMKPIIG
jgi:hypothetical protein